MKVFLIVIAAAVLLLLLILFLTAPGRRKRKEGVIRAWKGTDFAHRGMWGNGIAENSIAAFEEACKNHTGIELDVQLSRDGAVVVFHDDTLLRMTGDGRYVRDVDLDELQRMRLRGGSEDQTIPTFREVLDTVGGRVPILVEIKNGKRNRELCGKTLALLRSYDGRFIVESFSPLIVMWFRRNAPGIIRGQLVTDYRSFTRESGVPAPAAFLLSTLMLNILGRPDFIAYNYESRRLPMVRLHRSLFHTPMAAWVVRSRRDLMIAEERGEMRIFERIST